MTRPDNGAARVGAIIHEAYKQLATATEAKVLVIVNDDSLDFLDLREALNGYLAYGTGESRYKSTAARRIANGRIRDEKLRIDLYIWLNRYEGKFTPPIGWATASTASAAQSALRARVRSRARACADVLRRARDAEAGRRPRRRSPDAHRAASSRSVRHTALTPGGIGRSSDHRIPTNNSA